MERTLYVGLDDSNHSTQNKRAEIIVATFSFLKEDSIKQKWPNRKRYDEANRWIDPPKRDYRFLTLEGEEFTGTRFNLCLAAPYLINDFRSEFEEQIEGIKVYLDGLQLSKHKEILREELRGEFPKVIVDSFQKRMGVPDCPKVVDIADIWANTIYTDSAGKFLNNPKRVLVPNEEILKRALKFYEA